MEISLSLIDEVTAVFLWLGVYGLLQKFLNTSYVNQYETYVYLLLVLTALYFKL
jgi:hypothetical protein